MPIGTRRALFDYKKPEVKNMVASPLGELQGQLNV
jgi:hypothetical protein